MVKANRLESGKILMKDKDKLFEFDESTTFYICGASKFILNIRKKLILACASKDKIFREIFG